MVDTNSKNKTPLPMPEQLEIIKELMSRIPETIPSKTLVQIRIENKDKNEKQD